MKVGVLQFSPAWKDKEANFGKIRELVGDEKMDLLVLPELATTGYLFTSSRELTPLSEAFPGGESSQFLTDLAESIEGHVVCGVAEKQPRIIYNSAVLFDASGHRGTYRKVHLFDKEKEIFAPGNLGFPVFDIGQAKIGLMVCFDWIFPESARSLMLGGAEIICHSANLVLPYCPRAAVTRAVENHVFYLLADRVGSEKKRAVELSFIGQSRIISPDGTIVTSLETEEALIICTIDPGFARNKQKTPRNDVVSDRRPDQYRLN